MAVDYSDIINAACKTFLDNTRDMVFIKDVHSIYIAASLPFVQMAGKQDPADIVGKSDYEIFSDEELAKRYVADDRKLLASNRDLVGYIEPITDNRGQNRYSSTSKYILRDEKGDAIGILGISRDITHEYASRLRHQQVLSYLFELPEDTYAALYMDIDDWRIIRHHRRTVGDQIIPICDTMEEFAANAIKLILSVDDPEPIEYFRNLSKETMLSIFESGIRSQSLEYLRHMPNGSNTWVHTDIHYIIDPENGHHCAIWTMRDIDSQMQKNISIKHAAEYDEMTGVLNRASTMKRIESTFSTDSKERHALFMIDVDNFKRLNDTLGHQTGDVFLIALANALKNCFRESDVVGRIGGDEFFLMMKSIPNEKAVIEKAEVLRAAACTVCRSYPGTDLSISIGAAIFPDNGRTLNALYAKVDEALYAAKNSGKDKFCLA